MNTHIFHEQITAPLAFPPAEAARVLGIGRTRLYQLLGEGQLVGKKCGKRVLVLTESMQDFLQGLPPATIKRTHRT